MRRLVWVAPFRELLDKLKSEAATLDKLAKERTTRAATLHEVAERLEVAMKGAEWCEWVTTEDVARLRGISPVSVATQCRRAWAPQGLARKVGRAWEIHRSALEGRRS
jgi:proline dehydrogenase